MSWNPPWMQSSGLGGVTGFNKYFNMAQRQLEYAYEALEEHGNKRLALKKVQIVLGLVEEARAELTPGDINERHNLRQFQKLIPPLLRKIHGR